MPTKEKEICQEESTEKIIICFKCGEEVSASLRECPHCGNCLTCQI